MKHFKKIDEIGLMILKKTIGSKINQVYLNGNIFFDSNKDTYTVYNGNVILDREESEYAIKNIFRYTEVTKDKNFRKLEMADVINYNNTISKNQNILIKPINDKYDEYHWQDGGLAYLQIKEVELLKYISQEHQFIVKKQLNVTNIKVYGFNHQIFEKEQSCKISTDCIIVIESESDMLLVQSIAVEQCNNEILLTFNKNEIDKILSSRHLRTNELLYVEQFEINA